MFNHDRSSKSVTVAAALAAMLSIAAVGCSSSEESSAASSEGELSNKELAVVAFDAAFKARDVASLDTYFSPTFIRHNPLAKTDGTTELKALIKGLPASFSYSRHRVFGEGDYVVLHSTYDGLFGAGIKTVGFDLLKFSDGKIVEHWDCLQVDPGEYANPHTMVDGPSGIDASASSTEATRKMTVGEGGLIDALFLGNNPGMKQLPEFIASEYIQHDPLVPDGISGLMSTFGTPPFDSVKFIAIQLSVVEGDFAFGRSKMTWNDPSIDGSENDPAVSCDLFRVKDGIIQEHWDVLQTDPNSRGKDFAALGKNEAGHTMFE